MVAFNRLYRLDNQIETTCDNDRLYTLAASNGKNCALIFANLSGKRQQLSIDGIDLHDAKIYELGNPGTLIEIQSADSIDNNTVILIEL